ncbi:MAG: DUF2007 domain-containing protein [Paludibacter sp.]|nr:DUF2007 domain-containing protein [Paludibacter sp.]
MQLLKKKFNNNKKTALDQSKTIQLITCDNITEAYFIKDRLTNEGIECFLTNENFATLMPNYYNLFGSGIQVFVIEEDYEKSRELLKDKIEPEQAETVCPFCGSTEISFGLGKHKALKVFNILLAFMTGIPIGNMRVRQYCKTCREVIK